MHNSYPTELNTIFEVHNQYGNLTLDNWNKNEVSIDITISIWTSNEEKAQEYLDAFDVKVTGDSSKISFSSVIDQDKLDKSLFNKFKGKFRIDYIVHHPVYLKLNLDNSYGDITMQETTGKSYIYLSYGKLKAANLAFDDTKPLSKINVNYGKATIDKCSYCECDLSYSTLEIQKNTALLLTSNYSKIRINETYSLVAKAMYDDYKITQCNKMNINGSYSTISSDTLKNELVLVLNYGNCNIKQISAGFSKVDADCKYADFTGHIEDGYCYQVDLIVFHGEIRCSPKANIDEHYGSSYASIEGYIGCKGNTSSKVTAKSTYCNFNIF